jgi:hypothetical protein
MKTVDWLTLTLAVHILTGCGVTIEAAKVTPSEVGISEGRLAPTQVRGQGIVYALPRTEFEVIQPIKLKFSTAGGLRDIYGTCIRACESRNDGVAEACEFDSAPRVLYAPPELRATSVPDYGRLYQISPSADLFQSLTFKFEMASNGVVDKIDAAASNTGFEVLGSVASTLLRVAGAPAARITVDAGSPNAGKDKRTCHQVSNEIDSLLKQKFGVLKCDLAIEMKSCLSHYENDVEAEQKGIDDIFEQARRGKLKADVVGMIAAHRRDRLTAAMQRREDAASLFGLADGKEIEAVFQAILPMGGPAEFKPYAQSATLGPTVTSGITRVVGLSDNAGSFLPMLRDTLKFSTRHYVVSSSMPPEFELSNLDETAELDAGYRYRVPVSAPVSLTVYKDADGKAFEFGPAIDTRVIAQYGPVAALPSSFKGKSGHILIKHWPDSGGLQTVEIGAEALPTSTLTGVIDTAAEQSKARRDKAAASAAAAAAADPELDALTRQQKLLALKKQIKDLEAELSNGVGK